MANITPQTSAAPPAAPAAKAQPAHAHLGTKLARVFVGKSGVNFRAVNYSLLAAIGFLAVYFVGSVHAGVQKIKKVDTKVLFDVPAAGRSRLSKESARLKEIAFYMDGVQARDIFKMGPKRQADRTDEVVSSAAVEATKSLKLVGISWSDNPDAIIEDERTKQTYFVKKGGMVGDIKVESIFREKVILRVGQEAIELR